MKKTLLGIFLFGLLAFGLFAAYKFYGKHLEDKRRATFYENLVDTASPTVTRTGVRVMSADWTYKSTANEGGANSIKYESMYSLDSYTQHTLTIHTLSLTSLHNHYTYSLSTHTQ